MKVRVTWALAITLASGVGCREIIGVPGESDLKDIGDPPSLCQCSYLEQQGDEIVDACLAAHAKLADFGTDEDDATFASKEDLLGSSCAVCDGEEAVVSGCYGVLLGSVEPGAGVDGASCDVAPDCGSFACCAPTAAQALGGADTSVRSCCEGCLGCRDFITAGDDDGRLCAGSFEVARELVQCLCQGRGGRCPNLCDGTACEVSRACWSCLLAEAECDTELDACQSDPARPIPPP